MAQVQISDLVVDGIQDSVEFLSRVFGGDITQGANTEAFNKIVAAVRLIPKEAHDDVAEPIIRGILKTYNIHGSNRKRIGEIADIIALSLQDAMQFIGENMRRQQQATHALRAGQGGLLKG